MNRQNEKDEFVSALLRFKRVGMVFPAILNSCVSEINMPEHIFLKSIEENSEDSLRNICATDIQSRLHITKSAVSQMAAALEKKGYINRNIDLRNRRRIVLTLTPRGEEILRRTEENFNSILNTIFGEMGEADTAELNRTLNRFVDIFENIMNRFPEQNSGNSTTLA